MNKYIYYSEEEQIYLDKYKGHFNKKLADWAIEHMEKENSTTGLLEPIKKKTLDEFDTFIKAQGMKISDDSYYDAYYLWHMAAADYPRALSDSSHVANYIEETINDPDGEPTAVLACFKAKMENCDKPIFWEMFL